MKTDSNIEFENDRVRVSRIKHSGSGPISHEKRHDRLIIYLRDGHVMRSEGGQQQELRHKAGDVVWRLRSEHEVHSQDDGEHEVLVIEIKN